jgi:hypothetical protein
MRTSTLRLALAATLVLGPVAARAAVAGGSVTVSSCETLTGTATNCIDTGFLSTTLAGANSTFLGSPMLPGSSVPATFTSAFEAWDAVNGGDWTLVNGGTASVSITPNVGLSAGPEGAGLGPVLFILGGGSAQLLGQLVWTQALVINYSPLTGPLTTPEQTLDTFSLSQNAAGSNPNFPTTCSAASSGASPAGGAFCGPIYPFQYGSEYKKDTVDGIPLGVDPFYDAPQGDWPNAFFDAVTLLSTVSEATHTLTVYQGISYGFDLSATAASSAKLFESAGTGLNAPEPPVWALLIIALPGLLLLRRRQAVALIARGGAATV